MTSKHSGALRQRQHRGALRLDASAARDRFGEYGISVFGAKDDSEMELLATRLNRFAILTVTTAGSVRSEGLTLLPTFRRPHFTILLPDLETDLRRLLSCDTFLRTNAQYEAPEAELLTIAIDIDIDWNEEDETGLPWTVVGRAAFPERVVPGSFVVAGRGGAVAVAEVVDRDSSGVVHLRPLPGPVSRHTHLLDRRAV